MDISGKTFSRWTALHPDPTKPHKWVCECSCGNVRSVYRYNLESGGSRSCGCFKSERTRELSIRHGLTNTPFWRVWISMKERCRWPKSPVWKDYGGRGIKVCDRWLDFEMFLCDMYPTYRHGLTIERIDNGGNYEPGNCTWATPKQQAMNRRTNIYLDTPRGKMTVTDAALAFGISRFALHRRLKEGWSEDRLFEAPNSGPRARHGTAKDADARRAERNARLPRAVP